MFLQTDTRFRVPSMSLSGCFVMAALWHVAMIGKKEMSPESISSDIFKELYAAIISKQKPFIGIDCYVNSYDNIAFYYGLKVLKVARHEDAAYDCKGFEQEILVYKMARKLHATAGNGNGTTTYDPLGVSGFPLFGRLISKRILAWDTE